MKKYLLKSFALLAMLFSAITMSAVSYCGETITATDGTTAVITCTQPEAGTYVMTISSTQSGFGGLKAAKNYIMLDDTRQYLSNTNSSAKHTCNWNNTTKILTIEFMCTNVPVMDTPLFLNFSTQEKQFDALNGQVFEWPTSCEAGEEEPEVTDKWADVDWVAGSDNKYKVFHECLSQVVSVQQPGWAAEKGIYVSVPAGISSCTVNGAIDGAGMILYLSSFTAKETEVTITHGLGSCTFWVYYADGTEGGNEGEGGETPGEGGEEPEPRPDPTPDPTVTPGYSAGAGTNAGANYTYVYTNDDAGNVRLWVTFSEAVEGVAGPQFYTDGNVAIEATTTDNKVFYTSVTGKKDGDVVKLRARIPRAGGLTETPLLSHTVGTESGMIVTEYCNYTNAQLTKNGVAITLSWETADNGDVVITMGNGVGATSCAFRNGGFEGGIDAFVVSADNFTITTPASDYFTFTQIYSGNEARLVKVADLPKGTKIKHIGTGHALSWTVNGKSEYDNPDFIYTYGGMCNNLDAPTNVAITDAGVVTFDLVDGADAYEVHVYQGAVLKHTQDIVSGGTISFVAYADGAYTVKVVAKGAGKGDSEESDGATWNMTASPLPGSNYCETTADRITENHGACNPLFTWNTDASGNVVITVSASEGNEGETMFRNNGMNGAFSLDGSVNNFNAYFNRGKTDDYTYTLTLKDVANKPALGSVISFSGQIEAKSSIHNEDWSNYDFDGYLYGTKCSGQRHVTAAVDDAARGTATVNGQADVFVDENTEVTFVATANAGYVFVNWTKGNEVVSTSPTYTTTITSALTLRANFDYERIAYCHYEVLATGGGAVGKKLYLTLGSNGTGKYYIKFEGSVEAPLASLNNANYIVNGVSTDILVDGVNSSGQDVPFTRANGRWSFDAAGYGSAMMEFSLADGKTISDIFVWTNFIAFGLVGGGELIYEDNKDRNKLFGNPAPLRYNIDWNNVCIDDEAPVLVAPQVGVLNATDVQLTLKATDNWDGLITYNISYHPTSDASSPVKVSTTGASAEEITYDILALTTGVEYTFTITASDGTNTSAAQTCVVTPAGDTEKPIMGTATLVSRTHYMAVIAVTATDNQKVDKYRVVDATNAYDKVLVPTEGQITLTDLTAATAYNFTITAIDLAGNESENAATVECTTNNAKPTSAPTPPTHDAKQVKSVFSDVYGSTFSAMEGWGQATQFEELNFNGDYVRYYTNLNYLGWATGSPINASVMEELHLDIWAAEDATIMIVPIYGGQGLDTDDQKTKTVTLEGQKWNSIDLTLATDFAGLDLSSIFQFKFAEPQGTDKFAIDNVYFYTTQLSSDVTPPANLKATAVPSFTTAVINCQATDESGSISYQVYLGAELKGTGSADSGKTASITVTNLQPNREFTMTVIATDVYGNESAETVDVTFTTLSYPAPAPTPTWDATKVFSIYSDAYEPQANRAFGWWGASTVEAEVALAADDKALQYTTCNYLGWELNATCNVSDYPYLHMDIYVENAGSIQFTPIWGAEALKEYALQAGWNSLDINLVADFQGINLANINQMKWAAMPATCFIDNVYFLDGLIEGVVIDDDSDLTQLRDGFIYNLTLKRNLVMDEDWNTICLPFALTEEQVKEVFGEDTKLVELKSSELISNTEINLVFEDVTSMKASTPYLIKPAQNVDAGVALEGVVINLTPNVIETDDANMIPVLKTQSFTGENNTFYLGANENLYPRPTSREIKAMRAYFQFPNLTAAQASKLRARVVVEENVETALDNVSGQKQENIKVISNGQLIIIHDGGKYNAQGVKILE